MRMDNQFQATLEHLETAIRDLQEHPMPKDEVERDAAAKLAYVTQVYIVEYVKCVGKR